MNKKTLPNEVAAEYRTNISGWVCKTCLRFYGDDAGSERTARFCCEKDHACGTEGCKNRAERLIYCDPCIEKRDLEKWRALAQVPWDGETPLVLDTDDKFFFSSEELIDYLADHGLSIEDVRLVIAQKDKPRDFDMNEFLCDYLIDDYGDLDDKEINKQVNQWIEDNVPVMWLPGDTRPTLDSLPKATKIKEEV